MTPAATIVSETYDFSIVYDPTNPVQLDYRLRDKATGTDSDQSWATAGAAQAEAESIELVRIENAYNSRYDAAKKIFRTDENAAKATASLSAALHPAETMTHAALCERWAIALAAYDAKLAAALAKSRR